MCALVFMYFKAAVKTSDALVIVAIQHSGLVKNIPLI